MEHLLTTLRAQTLAQFAKVLLVFGAKRYAFHNSQRRNFKKNMQNALSWSRSR
jgi:hypothetical protein